MGNSPSTSQKQASAGHHPKSNNDPPLRREPKRRESTHAPVATTFKATPAPPSASLESAVGQPALTANSPSHARDIAKTSHARTHTASLDSATAASQEKTDAAMGNEESKPGRELTHSGSPRAKASPHPDKHEISSPPQRPVDAIAAGDEKIPFEPSPIDPSAPPLEAYTLPPASFSRPPRLPLPIEEEDHTPGSPILSPEVPLGADTAVPENADLSEEANRRGSVVSSNLDEEEEPDDVMGYMLDQGPTGPKVPVVFEWHDAKQSDRIYVTGNFAGWEKKYRLHWSGPSKHPNTMSATVQLSPGIYHISFLVNNNMTLSSYLPTTVDFTNYLMNYVEVPASSAAPVAVPAPTPSKPMDIRPKQAPGTASPHRTASPAVKDSPAASSPARESSRASPRPTKTPPATKKVPPKTYTSKIPTFLLDLDAWPGAVESPDSSPEHSSNTLKYKRALAAANALPTPPSLPQFFAKPILSQNTPTKDDASVLLMPNHTVLNHLATTNIKQGVLATSATTRYKQKFLTTIMYKPRSEDGD